ncbi:peroxidase-like isoform X2 [Watersipora subatra]|uniref:peroxidase-like isoform X2 n=1 Tax=Watersipora subatra TaxID=2589382 RepID=UPI00355B7749
MIRGYMAHNMLSITLLLLIGGLVGVSGQTINANILSTADAELAQDASENNFLDQFSDTSPTEPQPASTPPPPSPTLAGPVGEPGAPGFDGASTQSSIRGVPFSTSTVTTPEPCVYDDDNNAPCTSRFREPNGRCTNTRTPRKTWGMAMSPYSRILPPKYEDGLQQRRLTEFTSNTPLKSPREVSTTVTTTNVVLNFEGVSSHVMQWGQFIAHEFTQLTLADRNAACCPDQIFEAAFGRQGTRAELEEVRQLVAQERGNVCQQIELQDDPVYGQDICINHIRSGAAPLHNCVSGPREQMNAITHVFDASNVYGSSLEEQQALRAPSGGRMATQTVNGATLPPPDTANCPASAARCPFAGGDNRINTTPNLVSVHTSFIIKHNQIADRLATLNSNWDNERLFQETRRIIAAIQSNIHFYEWLPIVLGNSIISKYRLQSYDGHDSSVNPAIYNELAAAAFRFGHSLINGRFTLEKDSGASVTADLRTSFNDFNTIYNDGTKQCVRGLSTDVPWKVDKNFPGPMRDFLFNQMSDIVSLNINRGRDHGLNSYVDYRIHYRLSVPRNFNDLLATHPSDVVDQLRSIYSTVNDVELYIAGVTEFPVAGGLIGELFANILGDGFSRSRKGDRFFFESSTSGLSRAQIAAIRRYSYAQLTCEAHGLPTIVNKLFFGDGNNGARTVSCTSFPELDLDLWREGGDVPQPDCHWLTYSTTPCCRGRRTIYRRCVGQSRSCRCPGPTRLTERCRSSGGYSLCNSLTPPTRSPTY